MLGARFRVLVVVVGVVGAQCLAAQNKPFVECDRAELVQAVPELAGIQFEPSEDRLDGLLDATGGTAFQNSNNIRSGLGRAFADGRQYYLLAYVPSSSNSDGKFHSISVRLRESKMLVSAKRGYWANTR